MSRLDPIVIPGWTLKSCSTCSGRTYVEDGDTEPPQCHDCICAHGRKVRAEETTMEKNSKNKSKAKGNNHKSEAAHGTDHAKLLADGGTDVRRFTDQLPVPVTAEEHSVASTEFAQAYRRREATVEERREAMAGFRDTLTGIDEEMKKLAETVEKHTKRIPVECAEILCRTGEIRVVRIDTGEELEMRPASLEDRQVDMFDAEADAEENAEASDTEPPEAEAST